MEDYVDGPITMGEVYRRQHPGPGSYEHSLDRHRSIKFPVDERNLDFLNPYRINHQYTPGPQTYKERTQDNPKNIYFNRSTRGDVFKSNNYPSPGQYDIPRMTFIEKSSPTKKRYMNELTLNI
jgi:hypothetical protein